jgi:hypothetical protein
MAFLPARIDDGSGLTPRQLTRAKRVQADTDLAIYEHSQRSRALTEIDQIDSENTGDAVSTSMEVEIEVLDRGMSRAGQSIAKQQIVANAVTRLSRFNNRRQLRRFGG